jgi:UDP-2-acetamido-2-deoxy-ribo-hexuluronate aminotransferase
MNVPFIDLRRFEDGFQDRWIESCRDVSENTRFVGGLDVERLEGRLKRLTGATGVVGCANGTDALQLSLRAAGVGHGDVVVVPDATFWATFEAVVNVGARPVTVDIDMTDLQMDFEQFVEAVDRFRPRAAILVHLYGWGSRRLSDYRSFCRDREIPLVEDGAQAFGVTLRGESIFRDAQLATASFYPAKVLGACGDAGAVFSSDDETARLVRGLGNHGRTSHYDHAQVGWNSRMGGFEANYLDLSLDYIDARLASRRRAASRYREHLTAAGVTTVAPPEGFVENGYLNVCLIDPDDRPGVERQLREAGIGYGNVYPGAMSRQAGAAGVAAGHVGGDNAQTLSKSVLNLPLFAYIRDDEVDAAAGALVDALGARVASSHTPEQDTGGTSSRD